MTDPARIDPATISRRLGRPRSPEILDQTASAVERGHHLALIAAEGSGSEAVYAHAALLRCTADADGPQALVLAGTDERAARLARALHAACAPAGLVTFVAGPGWSEGDGVPPDATIVVARASRVLPAVRSGRVGLGALRLLVIDGVATLERLDEWSSVEPILDGLDPATVRIASSERASPAFLDFVERRLPRARRWPEELLPASPDAPGPVPSGRVSVAIAQGEGRYDAAVRCVADALRREAGTARVRCADVGDVPTLAAALGLTGFAVTTVDRELRVAEGPPEEPAAPDAAPSGVGAGVLFGLPDRLSDLEDVFEGARGRFAVVEPVELAQLEVLLLRAGLKPVPLPVRQVPDDLDAVALYRRRLHAAVRDADVVAELLVLEPLLREHGAERVAAALSGLLRRRSDGPASPIPWPDIEAASLDVSQDPGPGRRAARTPTGRTAEDRTPPRGARSAWSRIYMDIGKRDDVRPADLVGALTGEAEIAGGQIGKIEIRGAFSLVDIDSQVVDQVIQRMRGVTIRGQPVTVRLDRGG